MPLILLPFACARPAEAAQQRIVNGEGRLPRRAAQSSRINIWSAVSECADAYTTS
jgi:hypothetical protein